MKALIIIYIIVTVALFAVIPIKLLTSVQSRCPHCGQSVFYSKRKRNFDCPNCGAAIIKNGAPLSPQLP